MTANYSHLTTKDLIDECPSTADFSICCPCVQAGPTTKYMAPRDGLNLGVAPRRLLPVGVKEWKDTVELHQLLNMTLLLGHGTPIEGIQTVRAFPHCNLLMIAEARKWLDARASMESADQSLHTEEIEAVADAAKHERGHLDWRDMRLLSHLAFTPLLDDYYRRAEDETNMMTTAVGKSIERGDWGFSDFWWRTSEGTRNIIPTSRQGEVYRLMAGTVKLRYLLRIFYQKVPFTAGRRPRFLLLSIGPWSYPPPAIPPTTAQGLRVVDRLGHLTPRDAYYVLPVIIQMICLRRDMGDPLGGASGPIPKPEEPVFGRVPDQGPAVNDGHDDNDDESGCNEYEATWPAGLMSQHNQPQAPVVAVYSQSNNVRYFNILDYDGDEGDDLPYYYARVKPASEEQNEMSIDSPSTAPVSSAPSHPPTARFRDFIVKENLRKWTLKNGRIVEEDIDSQKGPTRFKYPVQLILRRLEEHFPFRNWLKA
ncbi:hypothetical protein CNMCM6936_005648 [Aspergillus lentulus]|nr:hypothetical protein CNMCM6936_005648 [Aspergillus lentulus]